MVGIVHGQRVERFAIRVRGDAAGSVESSATATPTTRGLGVLTALGLTQRETLHRGPRRKLTSATPPSRGIGVLAERWLTDVKDFA